MFLYIYMFVCLLVPVRLRFALWLDRGFRFWASRNRRSSVGDQVIWFFEFYKVEDPEHLFGEGKCPLTYYVLLNYNSSSNITLLKPKDWLALYLPCPWLPFGLLWLASCYCFTLINEHDVNTYDTMLSLWLWCWTGDTLGGSSGFSSASP